MPTRPDMYRAIVRGLHPLLSVAEAHGLDFRSRLTGEWFVPATLRAHLALGEYVWSAENWDLRHSSERVSENDCAK